MYAFRKLRMIDHDPFPLSFLLDGICYAIEEAVNPGYRYRIRNTSYFALLLTRSGTSDYTINGIPRRIEPGSLFVLPPGISFSEHVPGPDPCHNIYLMLEGALARRWARDFVPSEPFLYWPDAPAAIDSAVESAVRAIHADSIQHPWQIAGDLCLIGQALHEALTVSRTGQALTARLEGILTRKPHARWTVARMAQELGMSESGFAHTFRREVGVAPAAFVRRYRCRLARTLLQEGHSVEETAERLGFSNPFHFSRVYKQETGSPPSRSKGGNQGMHRPAGSR